MALKQPPYVSVSLRGQAFMGSDPQRTVVWVRGEHDIATVPLLAATTARAITLDDADVVIDLGGVEFMDASTIGAIIRTRKLLAARSRSLRIRSPSPCARRLLDVCALAGLIEPDASEEPVDEPSVVALATWVAVPATARDHPSVDAGRPGIHERVSFVAAADASPVGLSLRLDPSGHEGG